MHTRSVVSMVSRVLIVSLLSLGLAALAWPADAGTPNRALASDQGVSGQPDSISDDILSNPEYLAQADAQELGHQVEQAAIAHGETGYAGREVAPDSLVLYWKGELPASIVDLIADTTVRVEVRKAAFSEREVIAAIEGLLADRPPALASAGPLKVGPSRDWSGIELATRDPLPASVRGALLAFDGIPIRLSIQDPAPTLAALGRQNDEPPFRGGARIVRDNGTQNEEHCTTSFDAEDIHDSRDGILTARHCGTAKWYTPTGRFVGDRFRRSDQRDSIWLVGAPSYSNSIYAGSYTSSSRLLVSGHGGLAIGDIVQSSTSFSGSQVLRVTSVNQFEPLPGTTYEVGPGFWTSDVDGEPSIGQGDSGSPVVNPHAGTSQTHVVARGQVTMIRAPYSLDCLGDQSNPLRLCSATAFHMHMPALLNTMSLRLLISPP